MSHGHIPRPPAEDALPLDNLNARLMCADALFVDWPKAAAIVGNPPYQSKNKMQSSAPSRRSPTEALPRPVGPRGLCVYWFRRGAQPRSPRFNDQAERLATSLMCVSTIN
jgi:hypothetical protein